MNQSKQTGGVNSSGFDCESRVIAMDGPAACGKSTVARALSRRCGSIAFSTGLVYRALTHLSLSHSNVDFKSDQAIDFDKRAEAACATAMVQKLLNEHKLELAIQSDELRVLVDGNDPGNELELPALTRAIRWIAGNAELRQALLEVQRDLPSDIQSDLPGPLALNYVSPIYVVDGRDIGSVVFPQAPVKIFLTASAAERANRRYSQWADSRASQDSSASSSEGGEEFLTYEKVLNQIEERDRSDRERSAGPLMRPEGSHLVDSSDLSVEQVVDQIVACFPQEWTI